ncbi:MAG: peptidyl-prolyl cis-trans isomerase [Opitutales bacterium]|nr:peptidyl-prolyl cis-trans isomerase [Opitutales bacterium]
MLSLIERFLQHNRRWLFGVLLVVIVVPFVFTIGNMPGFFWKKKASQQYFGFDLSDRRKAEEVFVKGAISMLLRDGGDRMQASQEYALYRLWLLSLARDLKLPDPTEEQLQAFIKTRRFFWDEKEQQFKPSRYNEYLKEWKGKFSLRSLFEEDYKIEQVQNVMQGVACALPQESEVAFKSVRATYVLDYLEVKNEEKDPTLSDEEIRKFFEEHKEDYRVPQQADVTLLVLDADKFADRLSQPSEADLKAYFEQHKEDFSKGDEEPKFSDVSEDVKEAWKKEKCLTFAEEAASQLAVQVYEQSIKLGSDAWKRLLEKSGVRCIYSTPPYSKVSVPKKDGFPKELFLKAFELSEEHFLSDPQRVKGGVALVALNKFIPTHLPEPAQVREQVVDDAKRLHRQKAFQAKVEQIKTSLNEKGVPTKEFEVKSMEPFTLEQWKFEDFSKILPMHSLFGFLNDVLAFQPKHWSKAYKGNGDAMVFFYCKDKQTADISADSEEFKHFDENFLERKGRGQAEALAGEALTAAFKTDRK